MLSVIGFWPRFRLADVLNRNRLLVVSTQTESPYVAIPKMSRLVVLLIAPNVGSLVRPGIVSNSAERTPAPGNPAQRYPNLSTANART